MCDSTTTSATHPIAMKVASNSTMDHQNNDHSDKKVALPVNQDDGALLSAEQNQRLPPHSFVELNLLSTHQSINDFLDKKYKEHVLYKPMPQTPIIPPASLFCKTTKVVTPMAPAIGGKPQGRPTPVTSNDVSKDHEMTQADEEEMRNLPVLDFKRATSDDLLSFRSLLCFDNSSPFRVAEDDDDSPPMEISLPPVTDLARAGSLSLWMMPPPLLESISMSSMRVSPEPNMIDEPQDSTSNVATGSATPRVLPMPVMSVNTTMANENNHTPFWFPPSQARFTPLPMPLDPDNMIDWWSSAYKTGGSNTGADIPALSMLPRNNKLDADIHKRVSFDNIERVVHHSSPTIDSNKTQQDGSNLCDVLIPPRGKKLDVIKSVVGAAGRKGDTASNPENTQETEQETDPDKQHDRSLLRRLHHAKFSDSQNKVWLKHYKDACEFAAKHGHCCFPYTYEPNPGLTRWAKRQRHQYRAYKAGSKSAMTSQRLELLQDIGFVFELGGNTWQAKLDKVKSFVDNRDISINDINESLIKAEPENSEIEGMVTWLNLQRKHYHSHRSSPMTSTRIQILEKAGFRW